MKRTLIIAAALTAFISQPLAAQNAVSGSASQANNTALQSTSSGAIAAGGSVTNNFPAQPNKITTRQDGTATLKTAPSLGGLALGGGHPCAYAPATAQISIIGGGFGAGGMQVDEACMLLIMGASTGDVRVYNAGMYMLAARDKATCTALYKSGLIDDCTDRKGRSTVKATQQPTVSSNSGAARTVALDVECRQTGNKITPVTSKAVMDFYGRDAVMNACR